MKNLLLLLFLTVCVAGCRSNKIAPLPDTQSAALEVAADEGTDSLVVFSRKHVQPNRSAQPQGRIYRIAPEYADLVPVTMSGNTLVSYPAPSDITPATAPLPLADGWWLDRQGVSESTRFLKWTRSEYHDFAQAPEPAQIIAAIVPEAKISEIRYLPMTSAQAAADTAAVNRYIHDTLN